MKYPTAGAAARREKVRMLGMFHIFSWGVRVDFSVVRSLERRVDGGVVEALGGLGRKCC